MSDSRTLQILITAKNEAGKVLGEMNNQVEKLQPTFRKMAAVGTAATAAITFGIKKSVEAYQQQEKAEARLEQIARQVTGATDEQIEGYKRLASELQKIGVVGDEVIISGQSQLASFTKNADVVSVLTGNLADLAVAQYGNNISQDQAIQTANLLGKALSGQLGALTRTGILVSEDYKQAFEAANSEMERAEIISKIVADNYGGLNEAMRKTSEGGMQALKNDFGDMLEVIGKNFIPMMNDVVQKIMPVVASISEWIGNNQKLTTVIVLVTLGMTALLAVMGLIGMALPGLIVLFGILFSPVTLIIGAIVALIAVGYLLYKSWDEVKAYMAQIWDGMVQKFDESIDYIAKKIDALINKFKELAQKAREAFSNNSVVSAWSNLPANLGFGGARAMGGPVSSNNSYLVGENGPEMFVPNSGGKIIPNNKLGGGGTSINITVNGDISGQDLIEKVSQGIMGNLRNNSQIAI